MHFCESYVRTWDYILLTVNTSLLNYSRMSLKYRDGLTSDLESTIFLGYVINRCFFALVTATNISFKLVQAILNLRKAQI